MRGASKELQEVSLVALINDPYLLSKCLNEITEEYFENINYKIIYRCLKQHYTKYMVLPTEKELEVEISELNTTEYGTKEELETVCHALYSQKASSDDYMFEKLTEFIRRNKIENSLGKVVEYMNQGDINLDKVADDLKNSIYMDFNRTSVVNLADINNIRTIREEALGCSENPVIVKFFIDKLNECMQYKGLIAGTLNMVTAPPGRGKTTMLINQGVCTAQQGFKVLHVFLGDMSQYDGYLRYLSCFTGIATSKLLVMGDQELGKLVQKFNMSGYLSNIDIVSYAACQLTANQLMEEIYSFQRNRRVHYNVVIIDYDENIADDGPEDGSNMYKSGGNIYNKLALFAVLNKTVVFIASQPKTEFWGKEIITLEAASESSKKQKIIDLMITLGKHNKSASVGTLYIAKNRRGQDSKVFRISIDGSSAVMKHIDESEFIRLKQEDERRSSETL